MQEEGWVVCRAFQKPMPNQQQQRHGCYAGGFPYPSVPTYYYDGSNAAARLLMGGAAAPAMHDQSGLLAAESKLQVHHLLADMPPPLQSPALDAAGQSYEQSAAESSAVDWNLLSSLLPAAQLNFHQPPASPSCSKNNNDL